MDRRAIAVDEAMDRVTAVGAMAQNNHRHAMDETARNSFLNHELDRLRRRPGGTTDLLLPAAETKLTDKKLLPSTLLPTTKRTVVPFLSKPEGRGLRHSWPRNASAVVWMIRYPGGRLS